MEEKYTFYLLLTAEIITGLLAALGRLTSDQFLQVTLVVISFVAGYKVGGYATVSRLRAERG